VSQPVGERDGGIDMPAPEQIARRKIQATRAGRPHAARRMTNAVASLARPRSHQAAPFESVRSTDNGHETPRA